MKTLTKLIPASGLVLLGASVVNLLEQGGVPPLLTAGGGIAALVVYFAVERGLHRQPAARSISYIEDEQRVEIESSTFQTSLLALGTAVGAAGSNRPLYMPENKKSSNLDW